MVMKATLTRRSFLSNVCLAATGPLILKDSRSVFATPANESINVALIGVGGRGTWFVDTIPRMENVVAVCDVNQQKITEAYKRWAGLGDRFKNSPHKWESSAAPKFRRLADEKVPAFDDFRKMVDKMDKQIDAAVVSTPDHTHGVISAAAIRAGKHVFCEKPLTRTVDESRVLRELAKEHNVATSMGNQGTASGQFRRALELIRDGTIGRIKEVHVWNTGGGGDRKKAPGVEPAPEYLNWDLWLGPATFRPYHPGWLKRNLWRDFGTCQLGNWASHSANLAFMALKVHELWLESRPDKNRPIIRIKSECSGINRLSFPRWEVVKWEIPARAEFPPITFTWYNGAAPSGRERIEAWLGNAGWGQSKQMDFAGAIIAGTEGTIHANGHNATFRLLPEEKFKNVEKDRPKTVDRSRGHEMDWFIACRGGKPAWANFDYASALNQFLMLGNVATQIEEQIDFDPIAMKIINNAQADALLRPEYREGWSL
jgi:hypothetical protein